MKIDGKLLKADFEALRLEADVTPALLAVESNVSTATLYKAFGNHKGTEKAAAKVQRALERLRLRFCSPVKAVG